MGWYRATAAPRSTDPRAARQAVRSQQAARRSGTRQVEQAVRGDGQRKPPAKPASRSAATQACSSGLRGSEMEAGNLTPIEERMLKILSDGKPHSKAELHGCVYT